MAVMKRIMKDGKKLNSVIIVNFNKVEVSCKIKIPKQKFHIETYGIIVK